MNFAYKEAGEHKNALVKIRVCPECAEKLNFRNNERKQKEEEKNSRKRKRDAVEETEESQQKKEEYGPHLPDSSNAASMQRNIRASTEADPRTIWQKKQEMPEKTKEDEFKEFFDGLFL